MEAKKRCDQEDTIRQGKQVGAFAAPLHTTIGKGTCMVLASLV